MKVFVKVLVAFIVLFAAGVFIYRHSSFFQYDHRPMQYMPSMHHGPTLKPQRGYDFYKDGLGARTPPAGTLARTQKLYPYAKSVPAADVEKYSNVLPATREVVMKGQHLYMSYCVVCHGPGGTGDGYVVPPFPMPPSLVSEKIQKYADSQIFHIITVGQNVMGSYASQIREQDRWAVIHYVRVLQRAANPTPADFELYEQKQKTEGNK